MKADSDWPAGAYVAEYGSADALLKAVVALRKDGYSGVETFTPYPVPGLSGALGLRGSRLPAITLAGGIAGAIIGYGIQWYTNAISYPQNMGGRPSNAGTAFVVGTFEATVLCAALAAFFGLFTILRLPAPWHPFFEVEGSERATIDRFWLAVDARDPKGGGEEIRQRLEALDALSVSEVRKQT